MSIYRVSTWSSTLLHIIFNRGCYNIYGISRLKYALKA